mmetsp:Transcript_36549/g.77966  ORF Transcript_36549/g.77966 Transcript_36549/m.77966 type:complete len:559 (-) Transcript_36549:55-1731(-)|eukprot:CAMPEP_0183352570 /NCGR_PEP_ID=MMETSP0164_2-20130417/29523_1 /TAXON_ID=221442 /ORGANISM="Coccolithus pelagicus ssp braarudi, Strain PLY182g" /LENGTH=558 /DNA_ID=CAMNT_0025525035 /DNA_START=28 /DNA_END=1704 /DNA_ORIENTATION=-
MATPSSDCETLAQMINVRDIKPPEWCNGDEASPRRRQRSVCESAFGTWHRPGDGTLMYAPCVYQPDEPNRRCVLSKGGRPYTCADGARNPPPTPPSRSSPPTPPSPLLHLVFLLADDVGFNDAPGQTTDLTLAWARTSTLLQRGILINSTYTEPLSGPSRRSFLTGRQARLSQGHKEFSQFNETTIAQKLASEGYKTYAVGKWLAGRESTRSTPVGRGFHRFFGFSGNIHSYDSACADQKRFYQWDMNYMESAPFESPASSPAAPFFRYGLEAVYPEQQYITSLLDNKTLTFMADHKRLHPEHPLFLYYAAAALRSAGDNSHPERLYDACASLTNAVRRNVCAAAAGLDESVGAVVRLLESPSYAADEHLLIMSSDNGASAWREGSGGSNYPLRGDKSEIFEGGVRVFSLVLGRHTDLTNSAILGTTYSGGTIQLIDWHATLAALGGYAEGGQAEGELQVNVGLNVWSALVGGLPSPRREMLISVDYNRALGVAYRAGEWKLLVDAAYGAAFASSPPQTYEDDPGEVQVEVSGRHLGWWWAPRSGNNSEYLQRQAELA